MNGVRNFIVSLVAGAIGAGLLLWLAPQLRIPLPAATTGPLQQLPLSQQVQPSLLPGISSHEQAVVAAVNIASPAVVSIVLTADVPVRGQGFFQNPFDDFLGSQLPFQFQFPQTQQQPSTERREIGGGSGFLVSGDGLIVTNKHVVDRENVDYTVFTTDGRKHEATVVARDPALDLAVVKIEGNGYPFLALGNSDDLTPGQTVIAIGNALAELRNTVSVGVISGLSRSVVAGDNLGQTELLEEVVQTDAAINLGNSGGPLLNLRGQAVAVNVATAFGSENIGFAIPINEAQAVIQAATTGNKISRAFLGVRHMLITPALKEQENLPVDYGALIIRGEDPTELGVTPGSPADRAGLEENDIILEIDGVKLDEQHSLASQIRRKQVGQEVRLKVLHDGQEREVTATLAEVPQE